MIDLIKFESSDVLRQKRFEKSLEEREQYSDSDDCNRNGNFSRNRFYCRASCSSVDFDVKKSTHMSRQARVLKD